MSAVKQLLDVALPGNSASPRLGAQDDNLGNAYMESAVLRCFRMAWRSITLRIDFGKGAPYV